MESKVGAILDKSITKSTCKHHWIIEVPEGPTSKGVCKLCGEIKIFDNIVEELVPNKESKGTANLADLVDIEEV
jgi:hypothetical protein